MKTALFFSPSHIQITAGQDVSLASLDSVCCVSLHLSLVPGAREGVYYKWMFNVCLEELLVWLGFSGYGALETAAHGEGPRWALSGRREPFLRLAAVFSEGFLVLLLGSSFGRGELGEGVMPMILVDLLRRWLNPVTGVCGLSASGRDGTMARHARVRAGRCGSRSKEVPSKKSSWWAKCFLRLSSSWG